MKLTEKEKRLIFCNNGYDKKSVLEEIDDIIFSDLHYRQIHEIADTASSLKKKLELLSEAECMKVVNDIRENYRLLGGSKTIGEAFAEKRQKNGIKSFKGHAFDGLERFMDDTRYMLVFDVISYDSPIGEMNDRIRLFVTDEGYERCLNSQQMGYIRILKISRVCQGSLYNEKALIYE